MATQILGWLAVVLLLSTCACVHSTTTGRRLLQQPEPLHLCYGDFSATCTEQRLENGGRTLVANCQDDIGALRESRLELNEHVQNVDGLLVCSRTQFNKVDFMQSCVAIHLDVTTPGRFVATCRDEAGNLAPRSMVYLDAFVSNVDGTLTWSCL